jgi:GxxExxY protein
MMEAVRDLNAISEKIIWYAFNVANGLGSGFLEKVYENALVHELRTTGVNVHQGYTVKVIYDGVVVGDYKADLLVEECVLVELKTVEVLDNVHLAQCMNYLRASGLQLCLLINFYRSKIEVRRVVNDYMGPYIKKALRSTHI